MKGAIIAFATIACATARPAAPESINGLRVIDQGSGGVPVLFLHSLCGEAENWRAQLDHLSGARRVVAYDERGHGASARADKYTLEMLADDLETVSGQLRLGKFWLVGHSMSGAVITTFTARHPERLAGVIYVDAVGDMSGLSPEAKKSFLEAPPDLDVPKVKSAFGEMLGPKAKPATRERVLAAAEKCDPRAFVELRKDMASSPLGALAARYGGPRFAIEAEGNDYAIMASHLPGVQRKVIAGVSHWLMLDDPAGFNAALDGILK